MTKSAVFGVVITFIAVVLGLYHNSDSWVQETACYGSDHRCSKFKLTCPAENRIILGQMQYAFKFQDECVFGVSNCDQNPMTCCKYSEGDKLLSYWENDTYVARRMCSAKQSCSLHVPWIGSGLVISSYVRLSYRCAPEKSIVDMCSNVITRGKDIYLMFNGSAQPSPDENIGRKNCQCKISTTNCVSSLRISYTDIRVLRVNKNIAGKRCSSASLVTSSLKTMVDCDPGNLPMREPTDADILNSYQESLTLRNLWKYGENDVPEFLLLSVTAEKYESEVIVVCNMPESIQQRLDACRPNKIEEASKRFQESENPSQIGEGKGSLNIKQENRKSAMVDKIGRFKATQRRRAGVMGQSHSQGEKTSVLVAEVRSERHDPTLYSTSEWQYSTRFAMPRRTFKFESAKQKRETGEHSGRHVGTKYVDNKKNESSKTRENESLSTLHTPDSGQQESKFPNIQVATPKPLSPKTLRQVVKKTNIESSWPAFSFSSRPSSTYIVPNFENPETAIELNKVKYVGRVTGFQRKKDYNASNLESDNHNGGMFITSNSTNKKQSFYEHMTDSSKTFISPVTHESKLSGIENLKVSSTKNVKTVNMTRERKSNVGGISKVATPVKKENSSFDNASELVAENSHGKLSSVDMIEVIAVTDGNKSVQDETLSSSSSLFAFSSSVHAEVKAHVTEVQKHNDGLQESATRELCANDCSTKEMLSFSQSTELSSSESSVSVVRHPKDKMIFNRDGSFSSEINAYTTNEADIENSQTSESKIPCSQMTTEDYRLDNEKSFQLTEADLGRDEIKKENSLFTGDALLSRLSSSSFPSSWTSPVYSSKLEFRDSKETVTMPNWRTKEMGQSKTRAWGKRTAISYDQTDFLDEVRNGEMSKMIEMNDPIVQQKVLNTNLYQDPPLQRKTKTEATVTTTETSLTTLAGDKSEFTGKVYKHSSAAQIRKGRTVDGDKIKTSVARSSALFSSKTEPFELNDNVAWNISRPSMPKTSSDTSAVGKPDGKNALADNSTWEMTSVGNTKYIVKKSNAENTLRDISSSLFTSDSMSTISSAGECIFRLARRFTHSSSCRSSYPNHTIQINDSNKIATYVEKNSDKISPANEKVSDDASDYVKQVSTSFTALQQTKLENKIGLIRSSTTYRRLFVVDNSTVPETKSERPKSDVSDTLHPMRELAPSVKTVTKIPAKENSRNFVSDNKKPFRDLNHEDTNSLLTRGASEDQSLKEYQVHTQDHQSFIDEDPCAEVWPIVNNPSSLSTEWFLTNLNCTKTRSAPLTQKVPLGQDKISTPLIEASSLRISARKVPQKSDTTKWMWTSLSFIRGSGSNRGSANFSHKIFPKNENIESRSQHQSKNSLQSIGGSSIKPNKVTIKQNEAADNSSVKDQAVDIGPPIKLVQYPFHTEVKSIGTGTLFPSTFASAIKTGVPKIQTSDVGSWSLDMRAVASFHENTSRIDTEHRGHTPQKSTNKANLSTNAKNHLATEQSAEKELNTRRSNVVDFAMRNTPAAVEMKHSKVNEDSTEQIVKTKAKDDILHDQRDLPSNVSSSDVSVSNDDAEYKGIEVPPSAGLEKIVASTERKHPVTKIMHTARMDGNNEEPSRMKESEDAETPDILHKNEAKIIATEAENAKLIGKTETSKIKMEKEEEELTIEEADFNVNTKRNTTNTQEGNRRIVTSVICGALILLVLVGFIVLIYVRLHKVKHDRRQWNSPSISTIEKSDSPYNCYGHSKTASWSTVNDSQACFFARLSLPSRHILSPNKNLKAMNHPPILVPGKWPDIVTTPFDRPEVADKLAPKSRAAISLANETTCQSSSGPSACYPLTPRAGIYRVVQQ